MQYPNEEMIMQLARAWSVAPVDLRAEDSLPALGLLGRLRIEDRSAATDQLDT
jgi:hypothetical protein